MATIRKPHWVIYSEKKRAIWDRIFWTAKEAQAEFDRQMSRLTEEQRALADWKIEIGYSFVDEKHEKKSKKDDDFDGFN